MPIWLNVNPRSGVPIYLQLVEQIRHALEVGILRPGEPLPTVRQLASELTIAPNTIVKAYGELEALGLIESRAGAGTTVSAGLDGTLHQQAQQRLRGRLHQLVLDAVALGLGEQELRDLIAAELSGVYEASENGE
ncbi:MAG TPA: GntR family transcriptional regulator [Ktedonobacterales bacterium]|jgi:GntR family transcriptional regulator|nr:GntR family transcriptional regulator [Ktedonobacterales bacterium]